MTVNSGRFVKGGHVTRYLEGHTFDKKIGLKCEKCGSVHSNGGGSRGHNYDMGKGIVCRKCGLLHHRIYKNWNEGKTRAEDPRIASTPSWAKGSTKYTDPRLINFGGHVRGKTWEEAYGKETANRLRADLVKRNSTMQTLKEHTTIELMAESSLVERGIPYFTQYPIAGITTADLAIPDEMFAIYCNGCYWHGCKDKSQHRKDYSGDYLLFNGAPISRVRERDNNIISTIKELGWKVIVIWEHEFRKDKDVLGKRLGDFNKDFKIQNPLENSLTEWL